MSFPLTFPIKDHIADLRTKVMGCMIFLTLFVVFHSVTNQFLVLSVVTIHFCVCHSLHDLDLTVLPKACWVITIELANIVLS